MTTKQKLDLVIRRLRSFNEGNTLDQEEADFLHAVADTLEENLK